MINVTQPGPHDSLLILGLNLTVRVGETVEVPDDIGAQLIAQGWTPAGPDGDSMAEILRWVGDDPTRAASAIRSETDRERPRKKLLGQLESLAHDNDPAPEAANQED